MKIFEKILLFILSLIGLGFSISVLSLFYYIPFITDTVKSYQADFPLIGNVFAGYIAFLCLCFLLLLLFALFVPRKTNNLVLVKSKGRLQFSKQTVESIVRYSFMEEEGINFSKVRAKIKKQPDKTKIYVKLSVNDGSRLAGLTETVQKKIETSLLSSLSITVKSIHIKVVELNQSNKPRKEDSGVAEKSSEEAAISSEEVAKSSEEVAKSSRVV